MFNGSVIRTLRAAKGWTQTELAEAASAQRRQISHYENGKAVPDLATAYRLAKTLGVSIDLFFADVVYVGTQAQ